MNYEEGKEERLLAERKKLSSETQQLRESVDKLEARYVRNIDAFCL